MNTVAEIGHIDPIVSLIAQQLDGRVAYGIAEIAQMTGLSQRTILRRIADGSLPVIRSGGRTLIVKPQLQRIT